MTYSESDPRPQTETNPERENSRELNERMKIAAEYLQRLDEYAEHVLVDANTGAINYTKPTLEPVVDEVVQQYQQAFTTLIRQFADRTAAYADRLRQDPAILDVKEVAGALVATFNSSKREPTSLQGWLLTEEASARGMLGTASEYYLGFAAVDINAQKRYDGVSPTVSAVHELHHYMLSVSDYLLSQDETLHMESAYRRGRSVALYGSNPGRMTTSQAFLNDRAQYSVLLGREFTLETELPRVEAQLSYLNELHSSFLQRKDNWFSAQRTVYSTKGKGKHWELVGDHSDDIASSKRLLGYLQGFYTIEKIRAAWEERASAGLPLGDGQRAFLAASTEAFRVAGSLVGVARTVQQAELLVGTHWRAFLAEHARIATTAEFLGMLDQWEQGAGVDDLRSVLLVHETSSD